MTTARSADRKGPASAKFPLVVVEWDDAVDRGDGEGTPRHAPSRQVMVGWMLRYDDSGVSTAYEYSEEDGSWRNEVFIPAGMIVSVTELTFVGAASSP